MEFNQYNIYSMNAGIQTIDEVDIYVHDLQKLDEYEDVLNYINKKFGNITDQKLIEYPDSKKQIEIKVKDGAIEFFAAKEWKQYFGRGWRVNETKP